MKCEVAIIILTKDNPTLLERCISSVLKTNPIVKFKFYIADTGSTEKNLNDYTQILKTYLNKNNCRYIHLPFYNFAANHNLIIKKYVKEPWIMTCNDDIQFVTSCLDEMYRVGKSKKHVGTIGCRLMFPDGRIQHAGQIAYIDQHNLLQCTHRGYGLTNKYNSGPVVGNTAALMLIKKKIYNKLSGFDEMYTECWEDIHLNMKLILEGYSNIYLDDVHATHYESATRTKDADALYRLRYDYTYKLKPWFDSLDRSHQQLILNAK